MKKIVSLIAAVVMICTIGIIGVSAGTTRDTVTKSFESSWSDTKLSDKGMINYYRITAGNCWASTELNLWNNMDILGQVQCTNRNLAGENANTISSVMQSDGWVRTPACYNGKRAQSTIHYACRFKVSTKNIICDYEVTYKAP